MIHGRRLAAAASFTGIDADIVSKKCDAVLKKVPAFCRPQEVTDILQKIPIGIAQMASINNAVFAASDFFSNTENEKALMRANQTKLRTVRTFKE